VLNYKQWVEDYGSPLYVYELDSITNAYNSLKNALPDKSVLYYSLKANPNPEVTKHLLNLGCYAEISSRGELETALAAGSTAGRCLYTGPGKTKQEIEYALSRGVNHISIESWEELSTLNDLTRKYKQSVNITLRVNPSSKVGKASIKMTGVPSQFGLDEEALDELPGLLMNNSFLVMNGLHIYNGSNFTQSQMLIENFKSVLDTMLHIKHRLGVKLEFIDLGGGFAAPYGKRGELLDYSDLKHELETILDHIFNSDDKPIVAFESGRYLTATSGTLIGTVQSVKESKGKRFCVVDFGINTIGGMSGLGRIPNIEVELLKVGLGYEHEEAHEYTIVGPLCTPLDYISKKTLLSGVKPGDTVCVPNVGAYGLSASLIGFLSRDTPLELIIQNREVIHVNEIKIVRSAYNGS
jgi:diaminopimelate decarboxylase